VDAARPAITTFWEWARWYFTLPVTIPAIIVGMFVSQLGFFSVDQVMLQRYLSVKTCGQAQRSFLLNIAGVVVLWILLIALGMSLSTFYGGTPPSAAGGQWDRVLPYFAAHEMVAGCAGVIIAALFASTMSSIDSGINSATTAVLVDFYQRLVKRRLYPADHENDLPEERRQLRIARMLTAVFGLAATVLGCFVGRLGDIITIANLIINNFAGPMLGLFLLGLFTRRARPTAVLIAPPVAVAAAFVMTAPLTTFGIPFEIKVSSWWASAIGLVVTLVLGYGLSLVEAFVAPQRSAAT
jgi:sodium-coupled monocarboxylate transporter 8/12